MNIGVKIAEKPVIVPRWKIHILTRNNNSFNEYKYFFHNREIKEPLVELYISKDTS